jgi:guanylate kinase
VHYFFWSKERFERAVQSGEFLEWATVHGNYYGTLRSQVDQLRQQGFHVLLEIDVQGARQIREKFADCLTVFLRTSSLEAYEQRLRSRRTESEDSIRVRLANAQAELVLANEYDVQVVNEDLEQAIQEFRSLIHRLGGTKDA